MTTTLQKTTSDKEVSYVPFGAADPIKLSINIVRKLIAVPTKSGKLASDEDCMKFIMMCQAKRANPFEGDAYLLGYDGSKGPQFSFVTAHQLYLKRAEQSVDYDGMESGIIVADENGEIHEIAGDFYEKGQEVIGGWAKVYHKKRSHPIYRRIRLERFNKGFGQWTEDAAGMICKCAEADALRSTFPTMLGGLYTREEVNASMPTVVETEPKGLLSIVEQIESRKDDPKPETENPNIKRGRKLATEPAPTQSPPVSAGAGSAATDKPVETASTRLQRIIFDEGGVMYDDFQSFLVNQGICRAAADLPSVVDLPASVWSYLDQTPARVEQVIRLYGKASA